MSLNRCEFIGNLGADPEVRRMSNGDAVVNLRLAVSDRWTDKATGEKRERTTWVPVVIFNEGLGKVAEQYLRKGSKVFVAGEFSVRKWTDQQGQDKYSTEIVLNRFRGDLQMLDSKGGGEERREPAPADLDDSIPF
jgi:single-strand DNA-binding protein